MKTLRGWLLILAAAGLGFLLLAAADSDAALEERLARHRNLGKAFYENPTTKKDAVAELRKALDLAPNSARDRLNYGLALLSMGQTEEGMAEMAKVQGQDPSIPHTWFNLGIQHKRLGDFEKAIEQFEQMVKLVPDEPISHYNLGVLYKMAGRNEDAIRKFELSSRLDPNLAAPHFQLFNAYRQNADKEKATQQLELFKKVKEQQKGAVVGEDVEWSFYSELYDVVDPKSARDDTPAAELKFEARNLDAALDPASAGLAVLDADGDGGADLVAWSQAGVQLYMKGVSRVNQAVKGAISVAAGDIDNDGLADLCVTTGAGPVLMVNSKGTFTKREAGLPAGRFEKALWLDYDHDGDPDLFLLGAKSVLMRNQGSAGFVERTADFPFARGQAIDAVSFRVIPDTKAQDLLISYAGREAVLYRDKLGGIYEAAPVREAPAGSRGLAAADADNDGWIDVAYSTGRESGLLLGGERWPRAAVKVDAPGAPLFADLENRGRLEWIGGGKIHRNLGEGRFEAGKTPAGMLAGAIWTAGDFDGDGRTDLAGAGSDGLHLFRNVTATRHNWMRVALQGVKAPRLAPGAEVEVRAGTRYQKRIYHGLPLEFGLRSDQAVDVVRITWPNGLIQNEMKKPANQTLSVKEEERLSGSCPMIWTWNGRQFQFITDVLGVAPLGAAAGDGTYFPTDHDEYVQIPGEALKPVHGRYEIRVTEELSEVAYLDQVELIAVDHPAGIDIFTNEKFQGPPFPDFKLFGVSRRIRPVRAFDGEGRDVRARVAARDRRYPDRFRRNLSGVAELHALELDFGKGAAPGNNGVLVASGWVDWADGSTFRGVAQERDGGLVMPYLQVKDGAGAWRTVIDDMGIPAGKPKTIVVDLAGKFLSASREVRIVTNLCVYWDEIFLAEDAARPEARLAPASLVTSSLRFRGFSPVRIHPERKQPEMFFYAGPRPASNWNPTAGYYTRYGPVEELLGEADDRFVIMGSGDELELSFDAASLPELKPGWKRDFLLKVDGWAKDSDPNTAYSQTVEPLPFHNMSRYPYPATERYPEDEFHRRYREQYNTRPALRLLRPLAPGEMHAKTGTLGVRPVPPPAD